MSTAEYVSPTTLTFDVSGALELDGEQEVSTWVFAPTGNAERVPLLMCLPGRSYSKAYWHLEVPGHPGYSFAEYMAGQGMLVVAVDHLGTAERSRNARAIDLTAEVVAAANAELLRQVKERSNAGR